MIKETGAGRALPEEATVRIIDIVLSTTPAPRQAGMHSEDSHPKVGEYVE